MQEGIDRGDRDRSKKVAGRRTAAPYVGVRLRKAKALGFLAKIEGRTFIAASALQTAIGLLLSTRACSGPFQSSPGSYPSKDRTRRLPASCQPCISLQNWIDPTRHASPRTRKRSVPV